MKKIALIISLVILISSVFCVSAGATSLTGVNYNTIAAKELYVEIPAEFEFIASGYDVYFSFMGATGNLYVDMRENTALTQGLLKADEEDIKKTFIIDFILEGDETYIDQCVINFTEFKAEVVNGINMYRVVGDFCEKGYEDSKTAFGGYMAATKENVYYFAILDSAATFSLEKELSAVMSTVSINGTLFEGDKPTVKKDFEAYDSYAEVLATNANAYVNSYNTGDDYVSEEYPSSEEIVSVLRILFVVVVIVFIVPTVVITIVAIILIIKYSKNKKKLKKLEGEQLAGNVYQQSIPNQPFAVQQSQATAVAYGAEVQNAQPIPQPINSQPVPQPVATDVAEQKTILNGEIQEDNQQ